mmetsp:Transcript_49702/g.88842  ORF Transcript_49702/g.88842 Transcript_49702/m.88842 type:complete len:115 (-) Transcript_49702:112-456(-)
MRLNVLPLGHGVRGWGCCQVLTEESNLSALVSRLMSDEFWPTIEPASTKPATSSGDAGHLICLLTCATLPVHNPPSGCTQEWIEMGMGAGETTCKGMQPTCRCPWPTLFRALQY